MSTEEEEKTKVTGISWTGGKDCNLALLYAKRNSELDVKYLLTFRPENGGKSPFRAHPIPLMEAQAKSLGLELVYVMLSEPEEEEDKDWMKAYVDGITKIKHENGIEVICSGDIDLVGTMKRNWIEECCEKAGIESYLPLWKKNREECLNELLSEGYEMIYTCVKSPFFNETWINRPLNEDALKEMKDMIEKGIHTEKGVNVLDLCGERGEYHTMCVNGPLYQHKVDVVVNEKPLREDIKNGTNYVGNIWMISLK